MVDHRHEIPTWAIINALIIQEVVHTGDFAGCVRSVEKTINVAPGSLANKFFNSAYTASLLYCLIVVPKEAWLLEKNHTIYASIDKDWLLSLFDIELYDNRFTTHPVYYLIHHLRNSLAHARFSIGDDDSFTFWDQKTTESAPYFRACASHSSLGKFAAVVGRQFADLRLDRTDR